jgi:hypothetical protein
MRTRERRSSGNVAFSLPLSRGRCRPPGRPPGLGPGPEGRGHDGVNVGGLESDVAAMLALVEAVVAMLKAMLADGALEGGRRVPLPLTPGTSPGEALTLSPRVAFSARSRTRGEGEIPIPAPWRAWHDAPCLGSWGGAGCRAPSRPPIRGSQFGQPAGWSHEPWSVSRDPACGGEASGAQFQRSRSKGLRTPHLSCNSPSGRPLRG